MTNTGTRPVPMQSFWSSKTRGIFLLLVPYQFIVGHNMYTLSVPYWIWHHHFLVNFHNERHPILSLDDLYLTHPMTCAFTSICIILLHAGTEVPPSSNNLIEIRRSNIT